MTFTNYKKTIAKLFDLPYVIADATTLTEAGYVGEDAENLIKRLLDNADGDVSTVESSLYPNPSAGNFNVQYTSEINSELIIEIYDVLGVVPDFISTYNSRKFAFPELTQLNDKGKSK